VDCFTTVDDVGAGQRLYGANALVRLHVLVKQRRAFPGCGDGIEYRREFLILDLYEVKRVLGDALLHRRHRRHGFSDVANPVAGHKGHISDRFPAQSLQILTGHRGSHAGQFQCLPYVHRKDAGMRVRAPQHLRMKQTRKPEVGRV